MPIDLNNWWQIAIGGGLFVGGLLLGLVLSYAGDRTRARVRKLENELSEEREQRAAYQDAVGKHFGQTSDLFRDLTHQYTSLYAHLAEGARELCADRIPALGEGFGMPGLQAGAPTESGDPPEGEAEAELPKAEADESAPPESTRERCRDRTSIPGGSAS
jgi:uncharacterized membrane-anchored protein YhcB (DUF1043 family)